MQKLTKLLSLFALGLSLSVAQPVMGMEERKDVEVNGYFVNVLELLKKYPYMKEEFQGKTFNVNGESNVEIDLTFARALFIKFLEKGGKYTGNKPESRPKILKALLNKEFSLKKLSVVQKNLTFPDIDDEKKNSTNVDDNDNNNNNNNSNNNNSNNNNNKKITTDTPSLDDQDEDQEEEDDDNNSQVEEKNKDVSEEKQVILNNQNENDELKNAQQYLKKFDENFNLKLTEEEFNQLKAISQNNKLANEVTKDKNDGGLEKKKALELIEKDALKAEKFSVNAINELVDKLTTQIEKNQKTYDKNAVSLTNDSLKGSYEKLIEMVSWWGSELTTDNPLQTVENKAKEALTAIENTAKAIESAQKVLKGEFSSTVRLRDDQKSKLEKITNNLLLADEEIENVSNGYAEKIKAKNILQKDSENEEKYKKENVNKWLKDATDALNEASKTVESENNLTLGHNDVKDFVSNIKEAKNYWGEQYSTNISNEDPINTLNNAILDLVDRVKERLKNSRELENSLKESFKKREKGLPAVAFSLAAVNSLKDKAQNGGKIEKEQATEILTKLDENKTAYDKAFKEIMDENDFEKLSKDYAEEFKLVDEVRKSVEINNKEALSEFKLYDTRKDALENFETHFKAAKKAIEENVRISKDQIAYLKNASNDNNNNSLPDATLNLIKELHSKHTDLDKLYDPENGEAAEALKEVTNLLSEAEKLNEVQAFGEKLNSVNEKIKLLEKASKYWGATEGKQQFKMILDASIPKAKNKVQVEEMRIKGVNEDTLKKVQETTSKNKSLKNEVQELQEKMQQLQEKEKELEEQVQIYAQKLLEAQKNTQEQVELNEKYIVNIDELRKKLDQDTNVVQLNQEIEKLKKEIKELEIVVGLEQNETLKDKFEKLMTVIADQTKAAEGFKKDAETANTEKDTAVSNLNSTSKEFGAYKTRTNRIYTAIGIVGGGYLYYDKLAGYFFDCAKARKSDGMLKKALYLASFDKKQWSAFGNGAWDKTIGAALSLMKSKDKKKGATKNAPTKKASPAKKSLAKTAKKVVKKK